MIKKFVAIGIALLFVLMVFPTATLYAAEHTLSDGDTVDISAYAPNDTVLIQDNASVTVTGSNTNIRIRCAENVTLTIQDLTITNTSGSPITFLGTGNSLLLEGSSTLVSGNDFPGINVRATATLTINSTTGGTVSATGGISGAGIGGGFDGDGGTIIVTGGNVNATGGEYGAGIGGGDYGNGGTITISGGSVTARGGGGGAGIGGGFEGHGETIVITGGSINATGGSQAAGIGGGIYGDGGTVIIYGGQLFAAAGNSSLDIGRGLWGEADGSLTLSGSGAVFLRNDRSLTPVTTTTHTHELITTVDGGAVYGITMPAGWTPEFGAYLHFNTLSFHANGGTGAISDITGLNQASVILPDADALTRTNYLLTGWNTGADGSGTSAVPGAAYTLNGTETLFAQWTADPILSASRTSPIDVGESITLTPNITGGTWEYDATVLQRVGNTFTGLVAGAYEITYTVDGQSVSFNLDVAVAPTPTATPTPTAAPTIAPTASPTNTPDTGAQDVVRTGEVQSQLPTILILIGVCLLMVYAASVFTTRKKRGEDK